MSHDSIHRVCRSEVPLGLIDNRLSLTTGMEEFMAVIDKFRDETDAEKVGKIETYLYVLVEAIGYRVSRLAGVPPNMASFMELWSAASPQQKIAPITNNNPNNGFCIAQNRCHEYHRLGQNALMELHYYDPSAAHHSVNQTNLLKAFGSFLPVSLFIGTIVGAIVLRLVSDISANHTFVPLLIFAIGMLAIVILSRWIYAPSMWYLMMSGLVCGVIVCNGFSSYRHTWYLPLYP
eukprot:PhF_6_TR10627/c0_g1_i2/m.17213